MTWKVDNCINNSYKSQWFNSRPIWLLLTGFALQCSATGDLQVSDVKMHHDSCMCLHVQFNSIVPTCTNKPSRFDTTKWWMWNQIWPSSQMFCQGHCERLSTVMPHTVHTVPNTGTVTGNLILQGHHSRWTICFVWIMFKRSVCRARHIRGPLALQKSCEPISHSSFPEQTAIL